MDYRRSRVCAEPRGNVPDRRRSGMVDELVCVGFFLLLGRRVVPITPGAAYDPRAISGTTTTLDRTQPVRWGLRVDVGITQERDVEADGQL